MYYLDWPHPVRLFKPKLQIEINYSGWMLNIATVNCSSKMFVLVAEKDPKDPKKRQ